MAVRLVAAIDGRQRRVGVRLLRTPQVAQRGLDLTECPRRDQRAETLREIARPDEVKEPPLVKRFKLFG